MTHNLFTLSIFHRNLNPDTELKRIFGSVLTDQRPKGRKAHGRASGTSRLSAKLVQPKPNWPPAARTGLTMTTGELLPSGQTCFAFEHGPTYQLAQNLFWNAGSYRLSMPYLHQVIFRAFIVDGMNPEMFLVM